MMEKGNGGAVIDVAGAVDGHTHLFAEDGYVERHIEAGERAGVRRSVVSGLGGVWGQLDNAGILAAAERFPERLIPFAFVLLGRDGPEAVRAAQARGFRGLKFTQPRFAYDDERAYRVYEAAEESGLPGLFHCGVMAHAAGVLTSSEYMRALRLDGVARRFPGMRIQIAHLGVPEYEIATTLARIVPNIYVDMSGSTRGWRQSKTPEFIASLLYWETWHRKLIFGSDVGGEELAAAVRREGELLSALAPDESARASVYRDNALEFLGEIQREPYESMGMVTRTEEQEMGKGKA